MFEICDDFFCASSLHDDPIEMNIEIEKLKIQFDYIWPFGDHLWPIAILLAILDGKHYQKSD